MSRLEIWLDHGVNIYLAAPAAMDKPIRLTISATYNWLRIEVELGNVIGW